LHVRAEGIAMPINIEKYRKHLAPLELDKEREDEIIHHIYNIMDEFVSATFSKHPVQQALQDKKSRNLCKDIAA
jgi:hypothetical protein